MNHAALKEIQGLDYTINTKEQTVINSIKDAFEGEDMQAQYTVIGYMIDLFFININLRLKLMDQVITIEMMTMKYKDNKDQKENLIEYLLELILMHQILTFLVK